MFGTSGRLASAASAGQFHVSSEILLGHNIYNLIQADPSFVTRSKHRSIEA